MKTPNFQFLKNNKVLVSGVAAAVLGVAAIPLAMDPRISGIFNQEMDLAMQEIDRADYEIFETLEQCEARWGDTQTCETSQNQAQRYAGRLSSAYQFSFMAECEERYHTCQTRHVQSAPPVYYYTPATVAWQASVSKPEIAVPLYAGPEDGTAIRADGTVYTLDNSAAPVPAYP